MTIDENEPAGWMSRSHRLGGPPMVSRHSGQLDPAEYPIPFIQNPRSEWTHGNSVAELVDGNLLVSFRNISTVVKIDRSSGRVLWKLGPPHRYPASMRPCRCPTATFSYSIMVPRAWIKRFLFQGWSKPGFDRIDLQHPPPARGLHCDGWISCRIPQRLK